MSLSMSENDDGHPIPKRTDKQSENTGNEMYTAQIEHLTHRAVTLSSIVHYTNWSL